jgi:hypothetical protein
VLLIRVIFPGTMGNSITFTSIRNVAFTLAVAWDQAFLLATADVGASSPESPWGLRVTVEYSLLSYAGLLSRGVI